MRNFLFKNNNLLSQKDENDFDGPKINKYIYVKIPISPFTHGLLFLILEVKLLFIALKNKNKN